MSAAGAYGALQGGSREGDELIVRHAELVKRIAYHLAGRLPPSVAVDDLIQAGMLGLMEAAANYTASRGASFETYAGIRIRGAMIDALRALDWAPRSVHRKARAAAAAVREVERSTGRGARDVEIAQQMGVSLEEYHSIVQNAASCRLATSSTPARSRARSWRSGRGWSTKRAARRDAGRSSNEPSIATCAFRSTPRRGR